MINIPLVELPVVHRFWDSSTQPGDLHRHQRVVSRACRIRHGFVIDTAALVWSGQDWSGPLCNRRRGGNHSVHRQQSEGMVLLALLDTTR